MKKLLLPFFLVFITIHLSGQTRRYVNQAATGLEDGTSWADAYSDLQTAISACTSGDTLWVAAGTYIPSIATRYESFKLNGIMMFGGFTGVENSLDQRNPKENQTILSGDRQGDDGSGNTDDNSIHIVEIDGYGNPSTIDGFYIEGANANGSVGDPRLGGGIKISNGSAATSVTIRNCIIRNNFAFNGGGVYLNCTASFYHTVNIENCLFENNTCSIKGSAIYKFYRINVSVTNCTFISNYSRAVYSGGSDDIFEITNSIFFDHDDTYISAEDLSEFAIDHCLFDDDPSSFGGLSVFTNNLINTDPLLNDEYQLLPASPARDAGINDSVTTTLDLAGLNRIMNDTVDIGVYEFNTTPPEIAISTGMTETNDTLIEASVVFNEFISGLEPGDFEITNATMSSLTEVNPGLEYTLAISHNLTGQVTIELPAASIQNANEIGNNSYSFSYTYTDTIIPKTTLLPEYAVTSSLTQVLSVMFSEEVTGLELSDFFVTNGSASNLQTITEGFEYSVDITAGADGEVIITLPAGAVNDLNTLPNDTSRTSYTYSAINGLYSSNITDITIYPNPAKDHLFIDCRDFQYYELYNITGEKINKGSNTRIIINDLENGKYFLRIATKENAVIIKDFIICR